MAENKKSFVLYTDIHHTLKLLSDEQAGKLFKHILSYVNDENPETSDPITQISFEPIKQQFKRDLEKWEDKRKSRSEAGKKSGEVRRSKSLKTKDKEQKRTKRTNVRSVEQTSTKRTVNVNVDVNVDSINTILKNKTKKVFEIFDQTNMDLSVNRLKTSKENIRKRLEEFLDIEQLADGFTDKSENEILRHFKNWLRYNLPQEVTVEKEYEVPPWTMAQGNWKEEQEQLKKKNARK